MRNIEIGNHKNLSADKRGWQLKNIEIGRHSYPLCSKEFLPLSDLSVYMIPKACLEIEKYINFQDKCLFFCIKENYLFIIHHSEEAYCWYNTYLVAAYEMNPKEKKVCIKERNISWLRVSFILTAIGLVFICMWFIFFHILFA